MQGVVSVELPLLHPKEDISSWAINCLVGFKDCHKEKVLTQLIDQLPESNQLILFTTHPSKYVSLKHNGYLFHIEEFPTVLKMCRLSYQTPKILIFDHNLENIDPQLLKILFHNGRFYRLSVFFLMEELNLASNLRENIDNLFVFTPYKSTQEKDQQQGEDLINRYNQYFMGDLDRFRSLLLIATQQPDSCLVISSDWPEHKISWFKGS